MTIFILTIALFVFLGILIYKKRKTKFTYPIFTDWDRKFMAYHEAGHATVYCALLGTDSFIAATIDPTSESFGQIRIKTSINHNNTYDYLHKKIAVLLAGRLTEEILLNEITTSCIHDLDEASNLAYEMVCRLGMGKRIGVVKFDQDNISDSFREMIDRDIYEIIKNAEGLSREIIRKNSGNIYHLANLLLKNNNISSADILVS